MVIWVRVHRYHIAKGFDKNFYFGCFKSRKSLQVMPVIKYIYLDCLTSFWGPIFGKDSITLAADMYNDTLVK